LTDDPLEFIVNPNQARRELLSLSNRVALRMRREKVRGSSLTYSIFLGDTKIIMPHYKCHFQTALIKDVDNARY